jgi:hypothetical protein
MTVQEIQTQLRLEKAEHKSLLTEWSKRKILSDKSDIEKEIKACMKRIAFWENELKGAVQ